MKHIKLFEDLASMWDPTYSNDIFRIRYRSLDTLSNKQAPDTIDKPFNDVLDGIEEGDLITGKGIEDSKEHTGCVVRMQKDEKGENTKIEIEEDGEVIELAPSSVKFAENGDKGNQSDVKGEPTDTGIVDYTSAASGEPSSTFENSNGLKNIKKFKDF